MRNSSYLTKLIFFGCILCTLPVLCFGIFSYFQSSKEIQKQVNRGQMQLLGQMNSKVEETLLTINHALNQLVDSTVMSRVMNGRFSADDYQLYNNLRKEISSTQSFYTKLDDVVIINFRQNWMIKNSGFYRFDEYLHHSQISYEQMLPQMTSWVLNPTIWFYSEEKADAVACPYTISLIKKLPEQSLDKFGLAYANLSACSIADILNDSPRNAETIMIMDERGQLLYDSDVSMIGKYVSDTGFFTGMSMLGGNSGQFQTVKDGRTYAATYLKSGFNNWVYVSVIPIDSLTEEAKKIGRYTVVVCLIIVAVFVMIAWLGSRSMYTPIRRLMKQIADKAPPGKGARSNEFDVISDRMQDLFRSNSELTREVRQHLQQARTFFLIKMFQGGLRRQDLTEKLALFGFLEKMEAWRRMAVITTQIDTLEHTRYVKDDMELLLFAVGNMIEEIVPADNRLPPVFIEQTQVTLIGTTEEQAEAFTRYLYAITESIQSTVAEVLKLSVSIGISLPFDDPKRASVAYREGQEALKHRIHLGSGLIIHYANINAGKHRLTLDYPSLLESELADAIVLAEEAKARELLRQFMQTVFKHQLTPQEYQVPMYRLLNKLLVVMQESGVPLIQLLPNGGSLYEELQILPIASEIEEWFWSRVIAPMIGIFQDRRDSQYQNISEQVIDMIHKCYDTDLTIEKCAAALHYNANYLSGVFRKETNSTFSDYLTAYRFNIAKKWLATTDMTIKEIAERLQYMNSQNFIRSFRKQEKMTPGQYREMHRK
jgi:AraC-like DNA-binding protein